MAKIINRESFIATAADADGEEGTVEVTLGRETRRVRAYRSTRFGFMHAYGMVGRYQTSGKLWPASVSQQTDGREFANFGRDDRSGRFNKLNCLFFA